MHVERQDFYKKEQNLVISTSYGPGRYDPSYEIEGCDYPLGYVRWTENRNMEEFVRLMSTGKIKVESLVTSVENLGNAIKVYSILSKQNNNNIAVLFEFDDNSDKEPDYIAMPYDDVQIKNNIEKIIVGFIGAGSYVTNYLMPSMKNNFYFHAISNKTPESTLTVAKRNKIKNLYGDYKTLLSNNEINFIVIGTRHNLHSKIVTDALLSNKYVFVEKPLSLSISEVLAINELSQKVDKRVFVGFNRRYSSLTQQLLSLIRKSSSALLMTYRINAGRIPKSSWIHDAKIGGGRIIGEGCHFIDYCNYLAASLPIKINIQSVPIDDKTIIADDNYVLTIKYENGSLATIIYSSVGDQSMNKELIELFQDGSSFRLVDFKELIVFQNGKKSETVLKNQDKGRDRQMNEISNLLNGKPSIVPNFIYDINASLMSIHAQELLNGK
jgi:predicted dehydrogenase